MTRRSWLVALWSTLHEPRSVTIMMLGSYLVSVVAGVMLWVAPATTGDGAVLLRGVVTLLLAGGGLTGAPAAWRGLWWLERVAALAVAAGIVLVAILAVAAHLAADSGQLWVPLYGLALGEFAMLARFGLVRRSPFAPGKGPATTEQRAAEVRALMEEDTGGHRAVPHGDADDEQG